MPPPPVVYAVLPGGIDDPAAPSGGNTYDRQLCRTLAAAGWTVREVAVPGRWPQPDPTAASALAEELAALPDGAVGLLDGLVACAAPDAVVPESDRLRLVVLVHLPLADETGLSPAVATERDARERQTLHRAAAVVATSQWAARQLVHRHGLSAAQVHVAAPGVTAAPLAEGTDGFSQLLCVAELTPRKGQDLLVEALAQLPDRRLRLRCVGGLGRAPGFADRVRRLANEHGLAGRVQLAGPHAGAQLHAAYAAADLLVLASHAETYGMVVTEALARGIPVLATEVGGVPEALGRAPDGTVPGMLVPLGDPAALAAALRRWLEEPTTRRRLRRAAQERRAVLPGWEHTAKAVAGVLAAVRFAEPGAAR